MAEQIEYTIGSGNVFQDLGFPDAEDALVKSELARAIDEVISERGLTQRAAAELTGLTVSEISELTRGRLDAYSVERLLGCLTALRQDVLITIRPAPGERGRVLVSAGGKAGGDLS